MIIYRHNTLFMLSVDFCDKEIFVVKEFFAHTYGLHHLLVIAGIQLKLNTLLHYLLMFEENIKFHFHLIVCLFSKIKKSYSKLVCHVILKSLIFIDADEVQ